MKRKQQFYKRSVDDRTKNIYALDKTQGVPVHGKGCPLGHVIRFHGIACQQEVQNCLQVQHTLSRQLTLLVGTVFQSFGFRQVLILVPENKSSIRYRLIILSNPTGMKEILQPTYPDPPKLHFED